MSHRVLLVDDHRMIRQGLRLLVESHADMAVVGEASSAREGLSLVQQATPDVIVMDVHLPDRSGIEASREAFKLRPGVKIVALSGDADLSLVKEALQAGISSYVLKDSAPEELVRAIRLVLGGMLYVSPELGDLLLRDLLRRLPVHNPGQARSLSARELHVLKLTSEGLRTKEIAQALGVGVKTAETYRHRLMTKLGYHSTAELTRYAIREGLATP